MGQQEDTTSAKSSQKTGRFPPRPCLRKGCGCVFVPTHWKQRYCHEPDCERELHRWEAAKRQRKRRKDPRIRRQHAEQERERRRQRREERRRRLAGTSPRSPTPNHDSPPDAPRAWSRNRRHPENFCDRPGCYEPVRPCCRTRARYCGKECGKAMCHVRDRERKYKWRRKKKATRRRRDKHASRRRDRRRIPGTSAADRGTKTASARRACAESVRGYRRPPGAMVASREIPQEAPEHDRETSVGRGPRAPPSA
jgi:hypothetical protein